MPKDRNQAKASIRIPFLLKAQVRAAAAAAGVKESEIFRRALETYFTRR